MSYDSFPQNVDNFFYFNSINTSKLAHQINPLPTMGLIFQKATYARANYTNQSHLTP